MVDAFLCALLGALAVGAVGAKGMGVNFFSIFMHQGTIPVLLNLIYISVLIDRSRQDKTEDSN